MAIATIVGAGMMGTAMAWPLADNGFEVRLVGTPLDESIIATVRASGDHPTLQRRVPEAVRAYRAAELPAAIEGASLVVGGVSSFGVGWFGEVVGPHLVPGVPVLSVTKGLEDQEDGTLLTLPVALDRRLPSSLRGKVSLNAVGGPCIAHELAARRQTSVVFTGLNQDVLKSIRAMLMTDYYHPAICLDVAGVETCAALKNAYALGVALAVGVGEAAGPEGLAHHYNPQAALFGQSCHEMRLLVDILGGDPSLVSWLPGAGDLYVTVFGGRTVRLGKLLGQGVPFSAARQMLAGVTLESVEVATRVARALPKLEARGRARASDFPLLMHIDSVVNRAGSASIPWGSFCSAR
jgi:glycerol-3-phosphate dehydrogenase (NAD(P)+)